MSVQESMNFASYPSLVEANNYSFETQSNSVEDQIKEEDITKLEVKEEISEKQEEKYEERSSSDFEMDEKMKRARIREILLYILNNLGRVKDSDIVQERINYTDDPMLVKLFDALIERYSSTYKTKDEILKYITRKAFTTIRNNYKQKNTCKTDPMAETLCKRYFKASSEEIEKLGIDICHRENFLQVLFPYRKNCKNKSRYKDLISKLACSEEFYDDYCSFLGNFEEIMKTEKERKVSVFVPFLWDCVKRNQIHDVSQYKRIPWLDTWTKLANITAQEMSVALRVRVTDKFLSKKQKSSEVKNKCETCKSNSYPSQR